MRSAASRPAHAAVLVALASFAACDRSANPRDPVGPEPAGSGSLEVTVTVDGTRPDADGYAVVLANQDLPAEPVEPSGGTVRFTDVRAGSHSVRLEGLAGNCTVTNANPRVFTIDPEETVKLRFLVLCSGPGALLVRTVIRGIDLDPDGYALAIETTSVRHERIGTEDSLLIQAEENLAEGSWTLRLNEVQHQCIVASEVSPDNARVVTRELLKVRMIDDVTVRVTFMATCLQRTSRIVFQSAFWGSNSDIILIPPGGGSQAGAVNLTNHPAEDGNPALSPDGARVVFSSDRDDPNGSELYSVNANASGLTRLTHSPGYDWVGPQAWSPDGSRIVFTSTRDDPHQVDLYTMNADGSEVVRLTHDGGGGCNPAWSPDGAWIAFCKGGIHRMRPIAGSEAHLITSAGFDPAWSPDGSRIAYSIGYVWDWPLVDLAVIGVDGTGFVQLHPNLDNNDLYYSPAWSPDGAWIALSRSRTANVELAIVPFAGDAFGEVLRIAEGGSPSWR